MKTNYWKFSFTVTLFLVSVVTLNAQSGGDSNKIKKQSKDTPLKIKSRDMPNANVLNECKLPRQTFQIHVGVLATFDSSGKITDARIAGSYSSCPAFDEECLRITRKIKFKPEIKNGVAVTVIKPITYRVDIRGNSNY